MVSHGKSAFKLERMKHIRSTHEQFPCLMAAPDESIVHRAVIHQCRRKTSKNKSSTLIYQPCSVSPAVNCQLFLRPILGIICHEQSVHVEHVLQVADGVEQRIALLFSMVYCLEPTKRYWDTVCLKTLSPGVASRILVRQATATALLSRRNATCGFRIAEPPDWEIQQQLWGAFGICAAQLTFQKQGAWSCHHKSYKSARACKCNLLHCCCLPAINSLILT